MTKLAKILMIIWGVLAILSFVSAFFAPLYFKIIGLVFGTLNMLTIASLIIAYFQTKYYQNKLDKEIKEYVQLQEGEESTKEEGRE
jgi:preprotein translocase subunit SecF